MGDRLEARGGLYLRDARVTGEVGLLGAKLGGKLNCARGRFEVNEDTAIAINAAGLDARDVIMNCAKVKGEVSLAGAKISGELRLEGGTFCAHDQTARALKLDGIRVDGALILRHFGGDGVVDLKIDGVLDLTDAEVGVLIDAANSWPGPGRIMLDRFRYEAIAGAAPGDAGSRLDWLGRQDPSHWNVDFWPQPYEQCAKVLREMGHGGDARAVLIEKERLQRAARRERANMPLRAVLRAWDAVLGATIRYGRQPLWAFAWLSPSGSTAWPSSRMQREPAF